MLSVRSPLIFVQLDAPFVLLYRNCEPMYHVRGLVRDTTMGVSQFQRLALRPLSAGAVRSAVPGRAVRRSSVSMFTHAAFPFCDDCSTMELLVGSKCA